MIKFKVFKKGHEKLLTILELQIEVLAITKAIVDHLKILMSGNPHHQCKRNLVNQLREFLKMYLKANLIMQKISQVWKKDLIQMVRKAFFMIDTPMEQGLILIWYRCWKDKSWIKVQILHLMTLLIFKQLKGFCKRQFFYPWKCLNISQELEGLGKESWCLVHQGQERLY